MTKNTKAFNLRWFKDQIAKAGTSQRQIAKNMGINQAIISHTFHGRRKMNIEEAALWAELFKVPLQEVLSNAGVNVNLSAHEIENVPKGKSVPIKGWVDQDHVVHWGALKAPNKAPNPLTADACVRFQTMGGAYDGALAYYREVPADYFDPTAVGALCLVMVAGRSMLRIPLRGYEPGKHNLTLFNGVPKETGVVVEMATPIVWLKL